MEGNMYVIFSTILLFVCTALSVMSGLGMNIILNPKLSQAERDLGIPLVMASMGLAITIWIHSNLDWVAWGLYLITMLEVSTRLRINLLHEQWTKQKT